MQTTLSKYVKAMRKQHRLTQVELSEKSGVGLRFVRELEQGKPTLRLDNKTVFPGLLPGAHPALFIHPDRDHDRFVL